MKLNKRMVLRIVVALVITSAVGYVLYGLITFGIYMREVGKDIQQRQVRLLSETDHQALLEACREISRMVARGDLKKSQYKVRKNPDPEISRFPQVILDLEPTYVFLDDDGRVMLEMYGGLYYYGVKAYPEDYKKPSSAEYGDKELIPGLWYYEDDYERNQNPKKIEELIQKGKETH